LTNISHITKIILTLVFVWFLYKKTAQHEMFKKFLIILGSLFLSVFIITVAWTIFEGFFLE
jgi:hypothetical protein